MNVNDNMKINKKKINKNDKKDEVLGGENIVWKKKRGGVPCGKGHCHKTFGNKWNMERHLEAETEINCGHCNKGLMGKRNLRTHMKRSHEKFLKTLKCDKCDREFAGEKSLHKHIKQHDPNIGGGKFQCNVCMIYLPQKHCIKRHKNSIH